jgi:hypothetical protein
VESDEARLTNSRFVLSSGLLDGELLEVLAPWALPVVRRPTKVPTHRATVSDEESAATACRLTPLCQLTLRG